MESIQICKECKGTCHIAFQGLHVCGLVPALETTPVVLDQRKPVSYIGYVQEFGCSDHCTKVPGFYSFTDILRTECLECLHSIMSLAEPHYSWIYYINPKFYETMDDPQSMLFDFFPDAVWKLASIRTNIGQDEINVLKYMEGRDYEIDTGEVTDSEFLIKLHNTCTKTKPEWWPWSVSQTEMFIWACTNGMTVLAKWLIDKYRSDLDDLDEELDRTSYESIRTQNVDGLIVMVSRKYPKSELLSVLLASDLRRNWTFFPSPEHMIIDNPHITYEFYSPAQCSGCLEVCGCQYTGWSPCRRDRHGGKYEQHIVSQKTGLDLESGLVFYSDDAGPGYSIYYGNEKSKPYNTVIAVIRNKILSVYREPYCSLQLGDAGTTAEECTVDNIRYIRILNHGDVESSVLIRIEAEAEADDEDSDSESDSDEE